MPVKNDYDKIRGPDSTFPGFRCSGSWFRLYSKLVSADKTTADSPKPIATTTSAGGVTTVNTATLLAQPSVKQAIETLSAKAAGSEKK